jgi:hypothetical protein
VRSSGVAIEKLRQWYGNGRIIGKPEDPDKSPRVKFGVFGEEMIEKEVKRSRNIGRVYLPPDWVGKHVKIIRMD